MSDGNGDGRLSDFEKQAIRDRAEELRAGVGKGAKKVVAEALKCQETIDALPDVDRELVQGMHDLILATAPELLAKTMYGMPAYTRDGRNLCMIQASSKFETRYTTISFEDRAHLDDGPMWPTAYAITRLDDATRETLVELLTRA